MRFAISRRTMLGPRVVHDVLRAHLDTAAVEFGEQPGRPGVQRRDLAVDQENGLDELVDGQIRHRRIVGDNVGGLNPTSGA